MYQDAFTAFARAKELLPTDNNDLSKENKIFLKENLDKFDIEWIAVELYESTLHLFEKSIWWV